MIYTSESRDQEGRHALQKEISHRMSIGIVHRFEGIHIHQDQGKLTAVLVIKLQQPVEAAPVQKSGQRIMLRLVPHQLRPLLIFPVNFVVGFRQHLQLVGTVNGEDRALQYALVIAQQGLHNPEIQNEAGHQHHNRKNPDIQDQLPIDVQENVGGAILPAADLLTERAAALPDLLPDLLLRRFIGLTAHQCLRPLLLLLGGQQLILIAEAYRLQGRLPFHGADLLRLQHEPHGVELGFHQGIRIRQRRLQCCHRLRTVRKPAQCLQRPFPASVDIGLFEISVNVAQISCRRRKLRLGRQIVTGIPKALHRFRTDQILCRRLPELRIPSHAKNRNRQTQRCQPQRHGEAHPTHRADLNLSGHDFPPQQRNLPTLSWINTPCNSIIYNCAAPREKYKNPTR